MHSEEKLIHVSQPEWEEDEEGGRCHVPLQGGRNGGISHARILLSTLRTIERAAFSRCRICRGEEVMACQHRGCHGDSRVSIGALSLSLSFPVTQFVPAAVAPEPCESPPLLLRLSPRRGIRPAGELRGEDAFMLIADGEVETSGATTYYRPCVNSLSTSREGELVNVWGRKKKHIQN